MRSGSWPSVMPVRAAGSKPALADSGLLVGRTVLPEPDLLILQVDQRRAGLVQMMSGPPAVRAEPPGCDGGIHREVDQAPQLLLLRGIGDPDQQLNSAVEIAVHQVRAADPHLFRPVLAAWAKCVDPGMLEEPAHDAANPVVL